MEVSPFYHFVIPVLTPCGFQVLQDMLTLLKESVNSSHGEHLETIVIVLIGVEIILGILTILVDVFAG